MNCWWKVAGGGGLFITIIGWESTNQAALSKDGGKTWTNITLPAT